MSLKWQPSKFSHCPTYYMLNSLSKSSVPVHNVSKTKCMTQSNRRIHIKTKNCQSGHFCSDFFLRLHIEYSHCWIPYSLLFRCTIQNPVSDASTLDDLFFLHSAFTHHFYQALIPLSTLTKPRSQLFFHFHSYVIFSDPVIFLSVRPLTFLFPCPFIVLHAESYMAL